MQPLPAEVTACRYTWSIASPAAKTPGYTGGCGVAIRPPLNLDIAICHVQLAFKNFSVWSMSDGNEDSMYGEGRRFHH